MRREKLAHAAPASGVGVGVGVGVARTVGDEPPPPPHEASEAPANKRQEPKAITCLRISIYLPTCPILAAFARIMLTLNA